MLCKETQLANVHIGSRRPERKKKKYYKAQQAKQFMLSRASRRTHIMPSRDRGRRDCAKSYGQKTSADGGVGSYRSGTNTQANEDRDQTDPLRFVFLANLKACPVSVCISDKS